MPVAINCDPQALITAATPYQVVRSEGLENLVIIYLLNQILGSGLTPQQLIDAVQKQCYDCIPIGQQQQVIAYLLCALVNK